jgi:cell division protease FtsH
MAAEIDAEIKSIVTDCYEQTRELLDSRSDDLQTIAESLLEVETLTGDEVGRLLEGADLDQIREARAEKEQRETARRGQDIRPDEPPIPGSGQSPQPTPA